MMLGSVRLDKLSGATKYCFGPAPVPQWTKQ